MIQLISFYGFLLSVLRYNLDHFWLLLDLLKTWSELVCRLCIPFYVTCMMQCTTTKLVPWIPLAVSSEFVAKSVVADAIIISVWWKSNGTSKSSSKTGQYLIKF